MKRYSWLSLVVTTVFALVGCMSIGLAMQPTQSATATPITMPVITDTKTFMPTIIDTPLPVTTSTLLNTLEPEQVTRTLEPLIQNPMNCAVPCFWGIIPRKTQLDEVRNFFSRLSIAYKEGADPNSGKYGFSVAYESGIGRDFSVSFYIINNLVENIVITPRVREPKEVGFREWIAYSPETLIRQYGNPSRVQFAIDQQQIVTIVMIMYFDASNLIVRYSGYDLSLESLCPLTDPFDSVRLWIGRNPPDTPSFETVSLEKATSLTIDQFNQLMLGDAKKACFSLNRDAFQ